MYVNISEGQSFLVIKVYCLLAHPLTDVPQLAAEKSYPLESSKPFPFFPPVDSMIFEDEVI
jgi:hypothetical protein